MKYECVNVALGTSIFKANIRENNDLESTLIAQCFCFVFELIKEIKV